MSLQLSLISVSLFFFSWHAASSSSAHCKEKKKRSEDVRRVQECVPLHGRSSLFYARRWSDVSRDVAAAEAARPPLLQREITAESFFFLESGWKKKSRDEALLADFVFCLVCVSLAEIWSHLVLLHVVSELSISLRWIVCHLLMNYSGSQNPAMYRTHGFTHRRAHTVQCGGLWLL